MKNKNKEKKSSEINEKVTNSAKEINEPTAPEVVNMDEPVVKAKKGWGLEAKLNLVWSLLLIAAGAIFLLNNFGVLPWSIWFDAVEVVWKLWPLVLVLWGATLILGKSWVSKLIVTILSLIFIGFVVLITLLKGGYEKLDWAKRFLPKTVITQDVVNLEFLVNESTDLNNSEGLSLKAADLRDVTLEFGFDDFKITDGDSDNAILINAAVTKYNEPDFESILNKGLLKIDYMANKKRVVGFGSVEKYNHQIVLGLPELKTDLNLEAGAGNGEISFGHIDIGNMVLDLGAGDISVLLSDHVKVDNLEAKIGAGTFNMDLVNVFPQEFSLEVGLGNADLVYTGEFPLEINYEVGLGSLNVNGESFTGNGTLFVGEGSSSTRKVLNLNVGAGSISITNNN